MRHLICLLILSLLIGCRTSETETVDPDLLYRTYQFTEVDSGSTRQVIVDFTRQGNLLYGVDKQPPICCFPASFQLTGSTVQFLDAINPDPVCARVYCIPTDLVIGLTWQIEKLTADELVIVSTLKKVVLTVK